MTIQEKRKELSAALMIQREIDRHKDTLCDLRASGGVQGMATGPGGGSSGMTPPERAVEIQATIQQLKEDLRVETEIVRRQIVAYGLEERDERLLMLRYHRCLPWKHVAVLMGYTRRHAQRLEIAALENVTRCPLMSSDMS